LLSSFEICSLLWVGPTATFAALAVLPIVFVVEIAFTVAFGILLDTLLVRSLLVPALSVDIGRFLWWPGKLRRAQP
jgi:putative drug exporter of the RND superfamily